MLPTNEEERPNEVRDFSPRPLLGKARTLRSIGATADIRGYAQAMRGEVVRQADDLVAESELLVGAALSL